MEIPGKRKTPLVQSVKGLLHEYPLLFTIILAGMLASCASHDPAGRVGLRLYVSTAGNDNWSGKHRVADRSRSDGPFATLERARDAIRELKAARALPEGNVIVEVQGGVYELNRPFELDSRDSGTGSLSRIIYQGEKGREVRLSGGRSLTGWKPVTDQGILRKLSTGIRGKIWQANLKAAGISDFGSPGGLGMELFFNDEPMWISRYPNKGFMKITGVFNLQPVDIRGTKGDQVGRFQYDDQRISRWKEEKDAWVDGYWFWDWSQQRHRIAELDTANRTIEVVPPWHHYGYRAGQWFYGFNLLSEIDEPGEYYADRENGILYFYPPSDVVNGRTTVTLIPNIITMNQASSVTISRLILEGSRETIVTMRGCNGSLLAGCTLRNAGDCAVTIDGGMRSGVSGCDIYGTGAGGIRIDAGDRATLIPAGCYSDNNHIHHTARIKRIYTPCISLNGVGNMATHNLLAHVPHMAIYFNGNDHLIEYNEIDDVCYESNDAGAIYAGRNWTMRGNAIRFNYMHDISGFEGKGCVGIYLDDAFSSAEVTGNIFRNVTRAMMIGGGRDNVVTNNIFIGCIPSLHVDARGMGWMQDMTDEWIREAAEKGTILGAAYNRPPYSTRYPKLPLLTDDEPRAPKGNVISNNICAGGNWDKPSGFWGMSVEGKARPFLEMKDNIVSPASGVQDSLSKSFIIADPLFADPVHPEKKDFRLAKGSPALKRGFKQIPFRKIGRYQQ